ncbi:MFS general substrate transporter [Saccharata proteae CBS 121410]|uniref:MFS general substrate transporter n=1 Tax=Saccharata proteae CBS 121410 TaxID=1314787 RepID=A0A9P4HRK3_9PEZI|nr:MFS general substrate transporter [Saccharata proteae CBS 121410]
MNAKDIEIVAAISPLRADNDTTTHRPPFDPTVERRILRKLDFQFVPVLFCLFLVSFIDRGNIGNAKIQGLDKSLHLHGNQYNMAVMAFTLAYVITGIPMNIVFKKTGPKSLSVMMFLWGLTVIGQGLIESYAGLIACRVLEGICESGFIPGCSYLIGAYYKKDEFLKRYAVFFSAAILAGAINGLLATAISNMAGVGGYEGWRWIFIIEGLCTLVVSVVSWFIMMPFPEDSTIFSAEDKIALLARLEDDGGNVTNDELSFRKICKHLLDWKIWVAIVTYVGAEESAASVVSFQPAILKGLGYTSVEAQVHSIPIYAVSFVFTLTCAYISERICQRYVFSVVGAFIAIIGLAVEIAQPKDARIRYMGMFFVTAGPYLIMPITIVWLAINAGKGYKRTVAFACVSALGNCGAFVSSNVFITAESPTYHTGFSTNMAFMCISLASMTVMYVGLRIVNGKRDRNRALLPGVLEEKEFEDAGEDHPDFRYQL